LKEILEMRRSIKKQRLLSRYGAPALLALAMQTMTAHPLGAQTTANQSQLAVSSTPVSISNALGEQSPYLGSVPTGAPTGTVLPLSLSDAVDRGLKYNLGLIESDVRERSARAERLKELNDLLPNVTASISQTAEQVNLKALGFNFNIPGAAIPVVVGPFGIQDARGTVTQTIFDWHSIQKVRAANEGVKSSQDSYKSSRDVVVLVVVNAYLQVIADQAAIESQQAQINTSQALYQRARDQRAAGVAARIDELRAQVELQTQQQRLIAAQDQKAKDVLSLARVIGLPAGQEFTVETAVPYRPLEGVTLEKALQDSYENRPDYASAQHDVHAAELSRKAAVAEYYPNVTSSANYGDIGPNFGNSHGTFAATASLNIPIFQGTRVKADVLQADASLQQKQAELADLKGRIDQDVRSALLDVNAADELVKVAKSNVELAHETLSEAQDRFAAGVTDNIEVVQAQESVSAADQAYISSLYTFNISKAQLARAVGVAERAVRDYLGGT
jgi:outer membrane protein TolC